MQNHIWWNQLCPNISKNGKAAVGAAAAVIAVPMLNLYSLSGLTGLQLLVPLIIISFLLMCQCAKKGYGTFSCSERLDCCKVVGVGSYHWHHYSVDHLPCWMGELCERESWV